MPSMTTNSRLFTLGLGAAVITLGFTLGLTAAVQAFTQNTAGEAPPFIGRHHDPMAGPAAPFNGLGMLRMIAARLGLSDAQKEQIDSVLQSHRDEWASLADRAAAAHNALQEAVTADTIDDGVVRQRTEAVAAVMADMAVAGAHARAEIFHLLTPEQQAQVKSLESKMHDRIDQRRQRLRERAQQK